MITGNALIGLVVGILVGLTGIGGGLLLMPLMISVLGVPPVVAVGSDAAISCITKMGAGGLHWFQGNVRWRLVLRLASGSIPGASLGVLCLTRIRALYGEGANDFLRVAIGALLLVVPVLYVASQHSLKTNTAPGPSPGTNNELTVAVIGFFAGLLVGATSIGAGSVILLMLLIFCGLPPAVTVGTDIVHGVLLAGVTALLQFKLLRNVELMLVGSVLVGSLPGGLLGAYLAKRFSPFGLKRILCALVAVLGARMLWGVFQHPH